MMESLLDFVRRRLMRPLPAQPIEGTSLSREREAARPELERLASQDIEQLVDVLKAPSFGVPDTHGRGYHVGLMLLEILTSLDPGGELLRDIALEPRAPWYVRRAAVRALAVRRDFPHVEGLLPLLEQPGTEGEIREAILEGIIQWNRSDTLPQLRALREKGESAIGSWFRGAERLLLAAAHLGDPSCLRPLLGLLRVTPPSERERIDRTLNHLLLESPGRGSVLDGIEPRIPGTSDVEHLVYLVRTDLDPAVRSWALTQLLFDDGTEEVFFEALGDPDWHVAHGASRVLETSGDRIFERLESLVRDTSLSPSHRLWAAYTRMREDPGASLPLDTIPESRVAIPGLPEAVRAAIVAAYVPGSSPGTDVRWLIEALGVAPLCERDAPALAQELGDAYRAAGFAVGEIQDYASVMQQGHSSFHVVPVGDAGVYLSDFGPFALRGQGNEDEALEGRLRRIAEEAGWTWIDDGVADTIVTGLNVYYFGAREPLQVRDLLCYWQD